MDFSPRANRPVPQEQPTPNAQPVQAQTQAQPKAINKPKDGGKITKIMSMVMLLAITIIAVGVISLLIFGTPQTKTTSHTSHVNTDQYQAVFLDGGQVYFGKIKQFSNDLIKLEDIYYLRVNQQVQPGQENASNNISLAKLGNELHGPEDQMFLNPNAIQFWENLKEDGQVVKAIRQYQANPEAANQQNQQNQTQQQTNTNNNSNNQNTNSGN